MRKVLTLTLFTISIFSMICSGNVFATEFIPYSGVVLPKDPKICILNNTEESQWFNTTQHAIDMWTVLLDEKTNSHSWDIKLKVVDRMELTTCNVSFVYDLERHDWQNGPKNINGKPSLTRQLGVTTCSDSQTEYCQINIHMLYHNSTSVGLTIVHEFGHALGLGHRIGDTKNSWIAAWLSDDVMFPWAKHNQYITSDDINALIVLYGHGGFRDNQKIPDKYIITHPTKVPIYCNNVNATKGLCWLVIPP